MKKSVLSIIFLSFIFYIYGCANIQPSKINPEDYGPLGDYFITTMTLYDSTEQPDRQSVEINEKDTFMEYIRKILDNPDYKFSTFQDDLYYVAQTYNAYSFAVFTAMNNGSYEPINSTETQTTYKDKVTGNLMEIRTQYVQGRYGEFLNYYLGNGYYAAIETTDHTQLVMAKNFSDISPFVTGMEVDNLITYTSDKEAFWGIAENIIGLNLNNFNDKYDFTNFLNSISFEEDKQIGEALKKQFSVVLKTGEVAKISYIYKGKKKGFDFIYKPYHDVFTGDLISAYDYVRASEKASTWKYLDNGKLQRRD